MSSNDYEFDWDPSKALLNRRDPGITFDQAAPVFLDALALTVCDPNSSQGEVYPRLRCGRQWHIPMRSRNPDGFESALSQRAGRRDTSDGAMKKSRTGKIRSTRATHAQNGDAMPNEIDFSGGTRGKFYRPNARLRLPVYLDAEVQAYLAAIAARKGVPLSELANDLLKKEIAILETVRSDAASAAD
jgi:hypothetical protein